LRKSADTILVVGVRRARATVTLYLSGSLPTANPD
jgi:hypothetical protein